MSLLKKVFFYSVLLFPGLLIYGCQLTPMTAHQATKLSDIKLCVDYMTKPSFNIHQSARAQEIGNRGINCSSYGGVANARLKSEALYQQQLQQMRTFTQPQQRRQSNIINCNTVGGHTRCVSH